MKAKNPAIKTDSREKVAIWLDDKQLAELREIQQTEDVPVSASVRRAINEFLERRSKKK
jgi:hypothetical protein